MALIKCSECGKEISDTVKYCPNCGVEIKKQNSITDKTKTKNYIVIAVSIILIIIAYLLLHQMNSSIILTILIIMPSNMKTQDHIVADFWVAVTLRLRPNGKICEMKQ